MVWKHAILALNALYVWDSLVTWAVRAHGNVRELNPVITQLHQINPYFYISFRLGAILLANMLFWQIRVESPGAFESRWFQFLLALCVLIYLVPFLMSLPLMLPVPA